MTRATQKEQATTSLKTNSMNVNHVEYKQGFKNDLNPRSWIRVLTLAFAFVVAALLFILS